MKVRIVELKSGKFAMEVYEQGWSIVGGDNKLEDNGKWLRVDLNFLRNDRAEYEDIQILNNSIDSRTIKTVVREQEMEGLTPHYDGIIPASLKARKSGFGFVESK